MGSGREPLKILVAIKRVIDYSTKIRIKPDGKGIDFTGVKMSLNPFDKVALEEAIRLKEKGIAGEILVVSMGDKTTRESLIYALALGADRAIHVETLEETQPLGVAKVLKALVEREKPRLILLGKQAIDDDFNQTGQMLAALLKWPQGTFISSLSCKGNEIQVVRDVDEGLETLKMSLPAVVTTDLSLNKPRYPFLPHILKASQKPIEVIPAEALDVDLKPRLKIVKLTEPPPRKPVVRVENVDALLEKLHREAKVI